MLTYEVAYVDVMEAISYKLSMNFQVCYNPGLFLLSSYIVNLVHLSLFYMFIPNDIKVIKILYGNISEFANIFLYFKGSKFLDL